MIILNENVCKTLYVFIYKKIGKFIQFSTEAFVKDYSYVKRTLFPKLFKFWSSIFFSF